MSYVILGTLGFNSFSLCSYIFTNASSAALTAGNSIYERDYECKERRYKNWRLRGPIASKNFTWNEFEYWTRIIVCLPAPPDIFYHKIRDKRWDSLLQRLILANQIKNICKRRARPEEGTSESLTRASVQDTLRFSIVRTKMRGGDIGRYCTYNPSRPSKSLSLRFTLRSSIFQSVWSFVNLQWERGKSYCLCVVCMCDPVLTTFAYSHCAPSTCKLLQQKALWSARWSQAC